MWISYSLKGEVAVVRYVKISQTDKTIGWIASAGIGMMILISDILFLLNTPLFDDYIIFAIIEICLIPAVLYFLEYRWKSASDDNIPLLLRDLTEAQRAGLPLVRAMEEAAKREYGPLTSEIKKAFSQISWGLPFEKAILNFGENVGTLLAKRASRLMVEAAKAGARVHEIFEVITNSIQEMRNLELERRAEMSPYMAIVYVAFFIFLFITIILARIFFGITGVPSGAMPFGGAAIEEAKVLLFRMGMTEAFFSGLIAGKMGEGSVAGGLKHSVIMMTLGYFIFVRFVGVV